MNKSVNKLRKMKEFNDASKIKLKISNVKTAFNDRVFNIYIEPEQIGSFVASDIGAILGKAYLLSLKQIPKNSDFLMYSTVDILADLGPVYSSTSRFRKKDIAGWLEDCKDYNI